MIKLIARELEEPITELLDMSKGYRQSCGTMFTATNMVVRRMAQRIAITAAGATTTKSGLKFTALPGTSAFGVN